MNPRSLLLVVATVALLLAAAAASAPPAGLPAAGTRVAPADTPVPMPTSTPQPTPTATAPPPPTPTSTPLAQIIRERPTPVPAPVCLPAGSPAGATGGVVTSIAVTGAGRLIASVVSPPAARTTLYVSDDGAATWAAGRTFRDLIGQIIPSPAYERDRTLFATGNAGVYRSSDGGASWATITPGPWFSRTPVARHLAVSPAFETDRTILLGGGASPRGVFASTDGGQTWVDWLVDSVDSLLVSPNYAIDQSVWVSRNDERTFRRDVLLTVNQGFTWDFVRAGTVRPAAISPAYAQDSTIVWKDFTGAGLFLSRNSDRVFPVLEKADAPTLHIWRSTPETGWVVVGEQDIMAIAFSPDFAHDRTAFALAERAVVQSRDGGGSWAPVCYWPESSGSAPLFDRLAVSPNFASDRTLLAGGAGLAISRDAGLTWSTIALR